MRYDENGHMVKGWTGNADGKYYFDTETGAMAKGITTIDGVKYRFDEATGILVQTADSGEDFPEHAHVYILSSIEEATCTTDGRKFIHAAAETAILNGLLQPDMNGKMKDRYAWTEQ